MSVSATAPLKEDIWEDVRRLVSLRWAEDWDSPEDAAYDDMLPRSVHRRRPPYWADEP